MLQNGQLVYLEMMMMTMMIFKLYQLFTRLLFLDMNYVILIILTNPYTYEYHFIPLFICVLKMFIFCRNISIVHLLYSHIFSSKDVLLFFRYCNYFTVLCVTTYLTICDIVKFPQYNYVTPISIKCLLIFYTILKIIFFP
uniref:SJCHGC09184 protein n=1 Tax=Schistosoma japonicum TaxID=6182 RepID=Q5DDN8_SCHJA|nr:SJCHGC09184 protein [Schistosoma japonicum]